MIANNKLTTIALNIALLMAFQPLIHPSVAQPEFVIDQVASLTNYLASLVGGGLTGTLFNACAYGIQGACWPINIVINALWTCLLIPLSISIGPLPPFISVSVSIPIPFGLLILGPILIPCGGIIGCIYGLVSYREMPK
jgi:hypothetical protein